MGKLAVGCRSRMGSRGQLGWEAVAQARMGSSCRGEGSSSPRLRRWGECRVGSWRWKVAVGSSNWYHHLRWEERVAEGS